MEQRQTGTVRYYCRDRDFGFIETEDGLVNTFVHRYDVEGRARFRPGQRVSFVGATTSKGARATDVVIEDDEQRYTSLDELKATLVAETTEAGSSELRRPTPEPASSPHDVQDKQQSCHEKAQDVRWNLHICCHRHERGASVGSARPIIPEFR